MGMKKIAMRTAVAVLGVGAVVGSAPAFAISASTTGSYAYTSSSDNTTMNVSDTSADSRSAYGQYFRTSDPSSYSTLWNKSGSGTTVSAGGNSSILQLRACRQEQWSSDTCSGWVAGW